MTTRADLTAAANTGFQSREGYAYFHCAELQFGSPVASSSIEWTTRGDATNLAVYSSLDDGATWRPVARSGLAIPGLTVGSMTTNKRLRIRTVFRDGAPGLTLDSLTATVTFEDATSITRTETGADLATGQLIGVEYRAGVGGLQATPEQALRFMGNRGAIVRQNDAPHDGDGLKQGLHVSHGDLITTEPHSSGRTWTTEEQQGSHAEHRANASMAFEGWFLTEKDTGVLMGWASSPDGVVRSGCLLSLAPGGSIVFTAREFSAQFPPISDEREMHSPAGSVTLNHWHHVAFSYDGLHAGLYLDGVLVGQRAILARFNSLRVGGHTHHLGIVIPTTGAVVFGRHPVPAQNVNIVHSFQGRLTEWRIYSRALTAGAIIQRMRRRLLSAELPALLADDGLVAYVPMTDGAGTVAADASGNDEHFAWKQHQVSGGSLPPQLAWLPDQIRVWRGYPAPRLGTQGAVVDALALLLYGRRVHPGRESTPLDLDTVGETVRVTNAPFTITFTDGRVFTGVGQLGSIETRDEVADLIPTQIALTLSGIEAQYLSIAMRSRYLDRPCLIYLALFDPNGALVADPVLVFSGKLDTMDVALSASQGRVTVTAESFLADWQRAPGLRWNDEAHRAQHPDDFGLEFLATMVDREVWWPARLSSSGDSV